MATQKGKVSCSYKAFNSFSHTHTHLHTYTHTFTLSNKMFNSVQVNFVKCVECGSHTISEVCNNSRVDKINQHLTQFYNSLGFQFFETISETVGEEYTDLHKKILGYDVFEKDEKITFLSRDTLELIVVIIKNDEQAHWMYGVYDPEFFEALYELDRALAQQGQGEDGDGLEFRLQLIIN